MTGSYSQDQPENDASSFHRKERRSVDDGMVQCFTIIFHLLYPMDPRVPEPHQKKVIHIPYLDCIFHDMDQTYYVIDILCWKGYCFYNCSAEFRFFWLNSKFAEEIGGFINSPNSYYHKYRFNLVPVYNCDQSGLHSAYAGSVPYVKDGLLFYNKHAHYQPGNYTPLALVWKDENCTQYVIDTHSNNSKGQIQEVVLELQDDGNLTTSDENFLHWIINTIIQFYV